MDRAWWLRGVDFSISDPGAAVGLFARKMLLALNDYELAYGNLSRLLLQTGRLPEALRVAEAMVISALIVEAVVIALALAMIVNVYRHYPSGDIDRLDTLQG